MSRSSVLVWLFSYYSNLSFSTSCDWLLSIISLYFFKISWFSDFIWFDISCISFTCSSSLNFWASYNSLIFLSSASILAWFLILSTSDWSSYWRGRFYEIVVWSVTVVYFSGASLMCWIFRMLWLMSFKISLNSPVIVLLVFMTSWSLIIWLIWSFSSNLWILFIFKSISYWRASILLKSYDSVSSKYSPAE